MEGISSSRRGGEDVVIARDGVPLVRLVPVADSKPRPLLGLMKEIWIADDFDAPLDDFPTTDEGVSPRHAHLSVDEIFDRYGVARFW